MTGELSGDYLEHLRENVLTKPNDGGSLHPNVFEISGLVLLNLCVLSGVNVVQSRAVYNTDPYLPVSETWALEGQSMDLHREFPELQLKGHKRLNDMKMCILP